MIPVRNAIGGLGNLMFKEAYLWAQMREGKIPDVYVQGEKYWRDYKDEIKQRFGLGIGYINKIGLQIRRGDYLDKYNFYVELDKEYYSRAIAEFPNDKFLVFCYDRQDEKRDQLDREWTKEFLDSLIPDRWEFWTPKSETEDLNALASCKGRIIANSSFGWWAAYLSQGKTVCPVQWFRDGLQRIELLEEWVKV